MGAGITYSSPGQAEDSFGDMNTWAPGGFNNFTSIIFTLASGSSWTDAADVLTPTTGYGTTYYHHGFEAVTGAQDAGYYAGPAPSIGHGLPVILAVAGVLFGAGFMARGKKRGSFGVPHAG